MFYKWNVTKLTLILKEANTEGSLLFNKIYLKNICLIYVLIAFVVAHDF